MSFLLQSGSVLGCFGEEAIGQSRQARQRSGNGHNEEGSRTAHKIKTSSAVSCSTSSGRI